MTRPLSRRLLALALATALSLPAWAQTAFAPFTVSDIRIDGLQRIGAGTVFTYLNAVQRGETLDQAKAAEALRELYKTFKAGTAVGHCLENRSAAEASYIVVGTRSPDDVVHYTRKDMLLTKVNFDKRLTDKAGNVLKR